ncbi:MAG: hypothetical protein AB7I27_16535 [Bacteriovoracaceae bacterium]
MLMKVVLSFLLGYSFFTQARVDLSKINWQKLSDRERVLLIKELQIYTKYNPRSFAGCIAKNPKTLKSYQQNLGCDGDMILCNPILYGDNLCISKQENCQNKYAEDERSILDFFDQISTKQFKEFAQTIEDDCRSHSCSLFYQKLEWILPDTEVHVPNPKDKDFAEKLRAVQFQLETDISEFNKICLKEVSEQSQVYCRNLATRSLKASQDLEALYSSDEFQEICPEGPNLPIPEIPKISCSEKEKNRNSEKCLEDFGCMVGSSLLSLPLFMKDTLSNSPGQCLSSQNDCVTNFISSLVDTLVTLVTDLWDLLETVASWGKDKWNSFWHDTRAIEDKTSDAAHVLSKMSEDDVNSFKKHPLNWVSNLAKNIWKGINQWLKEDIFCEKWQGIPRMSQCLKPMESWDCLSCRTKLMGTCSSLGVVGSIVVTEIITGGLFNVGELGVQGARVVVDAIKSSKQYQKAAKGVEGISEVGIIKATTELGKRTISPIVVASSKVMTTLKDHFWLMKQSKSFQTTMKAMQKTLKYTGLKAISDIQAYFFNLGYKSMDKATKVSKTKLAILAEMKEKNVHEIQRLEKEFSAQYNKYLESLKSDNPIDMKVAIEANNDYIRKIYLVLKDEGIPVEVVTNKGQFSLKLNFSQMNKNSKVSAFYRRIQKSFLVDNYTFNPAENLKHGANAFYLNRDINLSAAQMIDLLSDKVNYVGLHEGRHAMFHAKRVRNEESIYSIDFLSNQEFNLHNGLNKAYLYRNNLSAEEVYTFSTDLRYFAKRLTGDPKVDEAMIKAIKGKLFGLSDVGKTTNLLSHNALNIVNDLLSGKKGANYLSIGKGTDGHLRLVLLDEFERPVMFTIVNPDQSAQLLKVYSKVLDLDNRFQNFAKARAEQSGLNLEDVKVKAQIRAEFDRINIQSSKEILTPIKSILESSKEKLIKLEEISRMQSMGAKSQLDRLNTKGTQIDTQALRMNLFSLSRNVNENYKLSPLHPNYAQNIFESVKEIRPSNP